MTAVADPVGRALPPLRRLMRAALFFVRRYLPCEVAGTIALLVVGTAVSARTHSVLATAIAGTIAETVGFYGVAFVVILREQRRMAPAGPWTLLGRTIGLGLAEFGLIDLADTALLRPTFLALGTALLPNAVVGLLAGKVAADAVFYLGAAGAYRISELLGIRTRRTVAQDAVPLLPDPGLRDRRCRELAGRIDLVLLTELADRHGPLLLLDPDAARRSYRALQEALPSARLHYAVKALDHPDVLVALAAEGAAFDVAGLEEIRALAAVGVPGAAMLFSNPIATPRERLGAVLAGVRTFVLDNRAELRKALLLPPGCRILVRLAYRSGAAHIDLSGKFGLERADAEALVAEALALGLPVAGFSFHVGSQTDAAQPFVDAVTRTLELMSALEARHGIRFSVLDIGGGFPVTHRAQGLDAAAIGRVIAPLLAPHADRLEILAEPGRCVVGDAAVAVARVVGVADRPDGRWDYLDDGVYGSWSNVMTEDVHPLLVAGSELEGRPLPLAPVTLAGPTCDSADVIARDYPMPELAIGDLVLSPVMGAYTAVTACRFNGRAPATIVPASLVSPRLEVRRSEHAAEPVPA